VSAGSDVDRAALTVSEWQEAQEIAVGAPASLGWPAGGMAWQVVQETGVASLQAGVACVPETAPMVKLPWQETLLQVLVVGSKCAPADWIEGFCEKSTANPVGEWHASQVSGAENALPVR
jgi:hypothetical protein